MLGIEELNAIFSEVEINIGTEPSQCSCCCGSHGGGKARYEGTYNCEEN